MSNVSQVRSRFVGTGLATSTTAISAEGDPADGAALTLTAAAATFSGAGGEANCVVQRITLTSGSGDDNSDVTYTITGKDGLHNTITEDLVGGAGGATVTSVEFYSKIDSIVGNGAASVDISAGVVSTGMHAVIWTGRTRLRAMHGVVGSAGTYSFRNTSTTGVVEMPLTCTTGDLDPYISDDGVLFTEGCFLVVAVDDMTGLTVYIDG
tara:strand:- start:37 stop:663 length:627 start_codon:yes stop_codon:yes gene_type:complete